MAAADPSAVPMLEHALAYLRAELPVFPVCSPLMGAHSHSREPCVNPGKTPLVRWRAYQLDLPSEAEVRGWWAQWPNANIGMCTGELSGILVLDADGTEARKECLRRGGLNETPTVWTGKIGGAHFHLAYPPGSNIRNFARRLPGTDLRGEGGYVLLPPSLHVSGNRYRWADGTDGIPASPPPGWLLELIAGPAGAEQAWSGERFDADAALLGFDAGHRDDGLFRFACRMRHDDTPQAYAEILIQEAARNCRPPFPPADAVEKVRRAYREYQPGNVGPAAEFDEEIRPGRAPSPETDRPPETFLRPISELLAMPEVDPDWLVDQLFTVGSSGWVAAEPKVGKSWLVLDLVYCLATGTPFLNTFMLKQPRRVIYIQEEDSLQRVLRRFKQLLKGDPSRRPPSDEYLKWAIRSGFKIDRSDWTTRLAQELDRFPADVVVLDVFNRLHGMKENDQAEMSLILDLLTRFTIQYGCSFIIVHHNRKPQVGSDARANQMMRGSGVLSGWAECSLYLRKARDQNVFIVIPESKDAPEMEEFSVTIQNTENGGVTLQIGTVSVTERTNKIDADIVVAVDKVTRDGFDATIQRIAAEVGKERTTIGKRLPGLVERGILEMDEVMIGRNYVKIFTVGTL